MHHRLSQLFASLALLCLLLLAWFIYASGYTGGAWYDDIPNLAGLAEVHDLDSAMAFVSTPRAGPAGRPIASASFLINAPSWPYDISDFLVTNTLIHLLNGALIAWLAFKLCQLLPTRVKYPEWLAVSIAALWVSHPLLLSASLMTVQRMATLCATFVFIGLLFYVHGIENLKLRPVKAFFQLSSGIGIGTLLAVFTKENGILLPLLALVLEGTLLHTHANPAPAWYRTWRRVFLILPPLLIICYIAFKWESFVIAGYATRDFTLSDRLFTQLHVLFDYLTLTFIPTRSALGPIHDDYSIAHSIFTPATTFLLLIFWSMLSCSTFLLRRKYPVFAFGVLWFIAAHSLESSVIPLELYFEHRNYVPLIGPIFWLAHLAWKFHEKGYRLILLALGTFLLLELFILHEAAETWGNRYLAAELWYEQHPNSERAAQFLSIYYSKTGQHEKASEIIYAAHQRNPHKPGLALQTLQLSCGLGNEQERLSQLLSSKGRDTLSTGKPNTVICDAADAIKEKVIAGRCGSITPENALALIDIVLENPRLENAPDIKYCLNGNKAGYYFHERNLSKTVEHMEIAYSYKPLAADAAQIAELLASAGLYNEGLARLNEALQSLPKSERSVAKWRNRLMPVKEKIEAMRDRANASDSKNSQGIVTNHAN